MPFMSINGLQVPIRKWDEDQEIIGPTGRSATTGTAYRGARAYKRRWRCEIKPISIETGRILRAYANGSAQSFNQSELYSSAGYLLATAFAETTNLPAEADDGRPLAVGRPGAIGSGIVPIPLRKGRSEGIFGKAEGTGGVTTLSVFSAALNDGSAPVSAFGAGTITTVADRGYFGDTCYRAGDANLVVVGNIASSRFSANSQAGCWIFNESLTTTLSLEVGFSDNGVGGVLESVRTYQIPPQSGWVWVETDIKTAFAGRNLSIRNEVALPASDTYLISGLTGLEQLDTANGRITPLRGVTFPPVLSPSALFSIPGSLFTVDKQGSWSIGAWLYPDDSTREKLLFEYSGSGLTDSIKYSQLVTGVPQVNFFGTLINLPGFGSPDLDEPIWLGLTWDYTDPTRSLAVAYNDTTGLQTVSLGGTVTDNARMDNIDAQAYFGNRGFASNLFFAPYALDSAALGGLALSEFGAPSPAVSLQGEFLPDDEDGVRALMSISFDDLRRFRDGVWRNTDRSMKVEFEEV